MASPLRLLIVSDTHHDISGLTTVLRKFEHRVDLLLHLGDGVEDLERAAAAAKVSLPRFEAVRGNGDGDYSLPTRRTLGLSGRKAFMAHGHIEGAGSGIEGILVAARAAGAGIAFFGHTHRPFYEEFRGLLLVNPGSLSRPRGDTGRTFALLDVPEDPEAWYDARFYTVGTAGGVHEIALP